MDTQAAMIALKDAKILNQMSSSGSMETATAITLNTVPANPVPCDTKLLSGVFISASTSLPHDHQTIQDSFPIHSPAPEDRL